MPETQAHYETSLPDALFRLAHAINESREVAAASLAWFQVHSSTETNINKKLEELRFSLEQAILRTEIKIMATVQEQVAILKEVAATQKKTNSEIGILQTTITELNQKILVLEQAVNNGEADPALVEIVAEVKALAVQADEQIPDVVTPVPV